MTPEQKAFIAYGYARRKVYEAKEMLAADRYAKKCGKLKNAQNAIACDKYMLKEAITESWKKRAACRAVIVSNDCIKCIRFPNKYPGWKCPGCEWATFTKTVKSRWEPRKEGE